MARLALRFISGKYKGGEYLLQEGKEIFVGRSSDIDLVIMEDMVSRKHARVVQQGKQIQIEDLGSTNGTFVNGERIKKATIGPGDRILIGTSIMKVFEASDEPRVTQIGTALSGRALNMLREDSAYGTRSMAGTIAEVPLPDLIQLFCTSKKTGTLVVSRGGTIGKINLDKGQLVNASIDGSPNLSPLKAIYRLLSWNEGTFELVGPEEEDFTRAIEMSTEHILMEGLRQLDELRNLQRELPPMGAELLIPTPLAQKLSELSQEELNVFQLVHNHGTLQTILDRADSNDLDAARIVKKLIEKGYISVA